MKCTLLLKQTLATKFIKMFRITSSQKQRGKLEHWLNG